MILHREGHPEKFTELHEEEREEGDRDEQEQDSRGERQIYAVLFPECSL